DRLGQEPCLVVATAQAPAPVQGDRDDEVRARRVPAEERLQAPGTRLAEERPEIVHPLELQSVDQAAERTRVVRAPEHRAQRALSDRQAGRPGEALPAGQA